MEIDVSLGWRGEFHSRVKTTKSQPFKSLYAEKDGFETWVSTAEEFDRLTASPSVCFERNQVPVNDILKLPQKTTFVIDKISHLPALESVCHKVSNWWQKYGEAKMASLFKTIFLMEAGPEGIALRLQ